MHLPRLFLTSALLASAASAQTVEHYWDFSSTTDRVGGVPTLPVGSPDLSLHPTYGEAYPGSGATLNPRINASDRLEARVLSGPTLLMDWGTESFSLSYWAWDDLAADGDPRGPRVFDALNGVDVGFQLASNPNNHWNFRNDDDAGASCIFNNVAPFQSPTDRWYHITAVVDRVQAEVRAYLDGALIASVPLLDQSTGQPFTGRIRPGQDLEIGVINGGGNSMFAQTCGLDDLAFYRGALTASDAVALASGALSPLAFRTIGERFCATTAVANSAGAHGILSVEGSGIVANNDTTLSASALPPNCFGYFLTSRTQGLLAQPGGSQGVLCLSGAIGRYFGPGQIQGSGAGGAFSFAIDLTRHPAPSGFVAVVPGETWRFQAWHRDAVMGNVTSNFTDAVAVTFQ